MTTSSARSRSGAAVLNLLFAVAASSNATVKGFFLQRQEEQGARSSPFPPSGQDGSVVENRQTSCRYRQRQHSLSLTQPSSSSSSSMLLSSFVPSSATSSGITYCCQHDIFEDRKGRAHQRKKSMALHQSHHSMDDDDDDDDDQIRPPPRNRPNTSAVDANTATVVATTPHLVVDDEQYTRMEIPDRATDSGHAIFGVLHDEGLIERYEIWKRKETMMRTRKERQLSLSSSSSSSSSPPPPSTSSKNAIVLTRDDGRVSVVAADDDDQDEETMSSNDDDNKNNNLIVAFVSFGNRLNGHVGIVHGGILSLVVDDLCGFAFEAIDVPHAVTANLNLDYRTPVPENTTMKISIQLQRREGRKLYWTAQMTSLDGSILYVDASSLYIIPRSVAEERK